MRRRPGVAGLQTAAAAKGQYKALGENVARTRVNQMKEQLEVFRKKLEEFALKHKNDIRRDPEFRAQFHAMCAQCGVDPLASRKGFWAEMLGIGDYYYELGVQIADVCLSMRASTGGLLALDDLRTALQRRRRTAAAVAAAEAVTEDDCMRAIAKLKVLGGGFDVITLGSRRYVRSVPTELSTDHAAVLRVAQGRGHVSQQQLVEELQWSEGRALDALDALLKDGVAMVDDGHPDGRRRYWFPALDTAAQSGGSAASSGNVVRDDILAAVGAEPTAA